MGGWGSRQWGGVCYQTIKSANSHLQYGTPLLGPQANWQSQIFRRLFTMLQSWCLEQSASSFTDLQLITKVVCQDLVQSATWMKREWTKKADIFLQKRFANNWIDYVFFYSNADSLSCWRCTLNTCFPFSSPYVMGLIQNIMMKQVTTWDL